jgi:pimeloyl-ACP methyl ester carboxylesterase
LTPRGTGATLETHIGDIAAVIAAEELANVALAGHSYSGLVISGAADRMRERLWHLVFLDALMA